MRNTHITPRTVLIHGRSATTSVATRIPYIPVIMTPIGDNCHRRYPPTTTSRIEKNPLKNPPICFRSRKDKMITTTKKPVIAVAFGPTPGSRLPKNIFAASKANEMNPQMAKANSAMSRGIKRTTSIIFIPPPFFIFPKSIISYIM